MSDYQDQSSTDRARKIVLDLMAGSPSGTLDSMKEVLDETRTLPAKFNDN